MDILPIDWNEIFAFSVSPLELVVRGTVIFWFLFALFRFLFRRGSAAVGMTDFLFVVLLGDAAQNAMIGKATSASDGMVLIGTLVFWNMLLDFLSYHFVIFERFTTAPKLALVEGGRVNRHNLRRQFISMDELKETLREAGHEHFDQVKAMYLESNGEISVIPKKDRG